jgi:UDP-2,3-diacylglucosamine pyrophosphatase LpxH
MVKQLWELVKSCGFLLSGKSQDERHFKAKDCEWKLEVKTTTQAHVQVLSGALRCLVLCDLHSPFFYPPAVALAIKIGKLIKPHLIILNGDIVDCFSVSPYRWSNRRENLHREIEVSKELLKFIHNSFPDTPTIYIEGNHELFLQKYIYSKASALSTLEELKLPNLLNFKGKDRYYLHREEEYATYSTSAFPSVHLYDAQNQLQLLVIHGDGLGISKGAVHYARLVHQRTLTNTICGHWHVSQSWQTYTLSGKRVGAWVFPPLCFPRPHWRNSLWGLGIGFFSLSESGVLTINIIDFVASKENQTLVATYGNQTFSEELGEENLLFD